MPDTSISAPAAPEPPDILGFLPLSADVVIKGRSAAYMSLYDDKASDEISAGNLKQFTSDPKKVAEAVKLLKKAGFSVTYIGKRCVSITGLKMLYEIIFNVKIVVTGDAVTATSKNGGNASAVIDTSALVDFKDLVTGVGLSQPVADFTINPTPDLANYPNSNSIPPDRIVNHLQADINKPLDLSNIKPNTNKPITAVVIESDGFDRAHPYFKQFEGIKFNFDGNSSLNMTQLLLSSIERNKGEVEKIKYIISLEEQNLQLLKDKLNKLNREQNENIKSALLNLFTISKEELNLRDEKKEIKENIKELSEELFELEDTIKEDQNKINPEFDKAGHGTMVCASLLATGGKALTNFIFYKGNSPQCEYAAWDLVNTRKNDKIIYSFSWGNYYTPNTTALIPPERASRMQESIQKGAIVFWAIGNSRDDEDKPTYRSREGESECITVGGANWNKDLQASNFTQGYKFNNRVVPDICGLSGNEKSPYLIMPTPSQMNVKGAKERGWFLQIGGSSSATPQVAGVAALLLSIYPNANNDEIRAILKLTAVPVKSGNWYTPPDTITLDPNSRDSPGLVNIPDVLILAQILAVNMSFDKLKTETNNLLELIKNKKTKP